MKEFNGMYIDYIFSNFTNTLTHLRTCNKAHDLFFIRVKKVSLLEEETGASDGSTAA